MPSPLDSPTSYLQAAAADKACGFGYPVSTLNEWEFIHGYEFRLVDIQGTVQNSQLSGSDNFLNHHCSGFLNTDGVDWNTYVVPDPFYRNRIVKDYQKTLQVEYEWCTAPYPTPVDPNDYTKGAEGFRRLVTELL